MSKSPATEPPITGPGNPILFHLRNMVLLQLTLVDLLLVFLPIILAGLLLVTPFVTYKPDQDSASYYGAGGVLRLFGVFVFGIFTAIHLVGAFFFSLLTRRNSSFRVCVIGSLLLQLLVAGTLIFIFVFE